MNNRFEITAKDPTSFKARSNASLRFNSVVSAILGLVITLFTHSYFGLAFGIACFIIQEIRAKAQNRFFIQSITFDATSATISYEEETIVKTLTGLADDFRFKKKSGFSRSPNFFLAIFYKEHLTIKQFEHGDWNRKVFDEVIAAFEGLTAQ